MPSIITLVADRSLKHLINKSLESLDVRLRDINAERARCADLLEPEEPDLIVVEIQLPEDPLLGTIQAIQEANPYLPIIMITGSASGELAIEMIKLGIFEYVQKPINVSRFRDLVEQALKIRRLARLRSQPSDGSKSDPDIEEDARATNLSPQPSPIEVIESSTGTTSTSSGDLPNSGGTDQTNQSMIGNSYRMIDVYKAIGRVAPQNVAVLIRGESGTGKELVAQSIVHHSRRADAPFLIINCAAIPESLLESELFGHEKGAFSGASATRIGKFEQCHGGTIFLDEIGDMPPNLQAKVLRLLQQQQFERIGSNKTITTDVRIIAATHRDLESMPEDKFRSDLFYRLNGFTIQLPPLRARGDDLLLFLDFFIKQFNKQFNKNVHGVTIEVLRLLKSYQWPGNVREFQSVIRQAVLQSIGQTLIPEFFPEEIRESKHQSPPQHEPSENDELVEFITKHLDCETENLYSVALEYFERVLLTRVLIKTDGNQTKAAEILGIARNSLRTKIRMLNLSIDQILRDEEEPELSET